MESKTGTLTHVPMETNEEVIKEVTDESSSRPCRRTSCARPSMSSRRPWCRECTTKTMYYRQKRSRALRKNIAFDEKYEKHHLGKHGLTSEQYDEGNRVKSRTIRRTKKKYQDHLMTKEMIQSMFKKQNKLRATIVSCDASLKKLTDPAAVTDED